MAEFDAEFVTEEQKQELSVISQLAQFDHQGVSETIIANVKSGELDPLRVHMFLKRIEKIAEVVKKDADVKEAVNAAGNAYGDKAFDYMGATLKMGAVHTAYDYSTCGDPLWDNLNEIMANVKEMIKARELVLKAAFPENIGFGFKPPIMVVQDLYSLQTMDCGEEFTLSQPRKIQQMGLKVTFKKK